MAIRDLVRGTVSWSQLEAVALELARRRDRDEIRVEFLEADNWLSVPCVVDGELFVKMITRQNAMVQAVFTAGRNLGAVTTGRQGFFQRSSDPVEMAEREFEATRRIREAGINAPAPVDAFKLDGLGVLVLEYLPEFRPIGDLSTDELRAVVDDVFGCLARLHDHGLVHGDLHAQNVLLCGDELYFIDATSIRDDAADTDCPGHARAQAHDLACALGMLVPRLGARDTVRAALNHYDCDALVRASEFLDFVNLRFEHRFDAAEVKGEIEKVAA
jgi:serine/threonine protein kinase